MEEPTVNATCPECDAAIALAADTVEGEILVCPDCAAELEVTNVDPPTLSLAPEVGEDWGE
jgi:alpha-aminoadipate carrier protein LysW